MKMILYISSNFRHCGPVNQLFNIVSKLDRDKFRPIILTLSPEPEENSMKDAFDKLNIQIDSLQLSRLQGMVKGGFLFKKYIRSIQPDLIHTQGFRPDTMMQKIRNVPKVSTIRMDPGMDYPMKYGKFLGGWMKRKHLSAIRKSPNAVLCSKSLKDIFNKQYKINRDFIPNGVDTQIYQPVDEEQKKQLRQKHDLPADKTIFIYSGSLIKRKNLEILIKTFLNVSEEYFLLIAGDGVLMEDLKKMSGGKSNILLTGQVNYVNELLQASDVFLSPSLSEGLPNTVLEAMACGLPLMLSDIPQHKDIFDQDDPVKFFKANDAGMLKQKIDKIHQMDMKDRGEVMRSIVDEKYSSGFMAEQYQELYQKIGS